MTGIKMLVSFVLGALCASGWWAAARWGNEMFIAPVVATFALVIYCVYWLIVHWQDDE